MKKTLSFIGTLILGLLYLIFKVLGHLILTIFACICFCIAFKYSTGIALDLMKVVILWYGTLLLVYPFKNSLVRK